jgi:glycolate oxidase iron-sulfur subunit
MRALARGDLALTERLETHLARCLGCRACEDVCPSRVPYGALLDSARRLIESRGTRRWHRRVLRNIGLSVLAHPRWLNTLGTLAHLYTRSGLRRLVRASRFLRRLGLARWEAEVPEITSQTPWREHYPATAPKRGRVALFLGCIANINDRETLRAAIRVLNRIGYDVVVPRAQACCGAVHRHHGDATRADALLARNLAAFGMDVDAIISTSSGCGATLAAYGEARADDTRAHVFAAKVRDISEFLVSVWPSDLQLRALPKTIAVHDPCSLKNVLRLHAHPYALLRKIPGATVIALPDNATCCGFAGLYHLTQPDLADALRANKVRHVQSVFPDVVTSSNSGCGSYLGHALRDAGTPLRVCHPVTLLAEQLPP